MKKLLCLAACAALVTATSGCANGPIRNFLRGAACNTCTPPMNQPMGCGTNIAPACNDCNGGMIAPAPVPTPAPIGATYDGGFQSAPIAAPIDPGFGDAPAIAPPNEIVMPGAVGYSETNAYVPQGVYQIDPSAVQGIESAPARTVSDSNSIGSSNRNEVPSAEVYGANIGEIVTPPSIGRFRSN